MHARCCRVVLAMLLLIAMPTAAHADFLFTPFATVSFGGDLDRIRGGYGGSVAWMGGRAVGLEFELADGAARWG